MHTLTLLMLAIATAVPVFGRASEPQGVSEINEEDPPTVSSPPSSLQPYTGITAPEFINKYLFNEFEYSQKKHALVQARKLADFFKNEIQAETPSEPQAIADGWFKKALRGIQDKEEQPSWIDIDKEDKRNFLIKSEFKSSGSIELAPYVDPNEFGEKEKNVEDGLDDNLKQSFAASPYDFGYYDPKIETPTTVTQYEPPRQTRQNVASRTKTLVSDDLDQLRAGFSHEAVSKKPQIFLYEGAQGGSSSFYDVFMLAAICLGVALTLFGIMFGLYKISLNTKAAKKMDYPAYGVTGPTCDTSADTNLAKCAQMYHYQHQKQQMISMEKIGMDTRSVSDHESEEEGDYTVYECPGLATTGNMEVQNPIFDEGATQLPATKVVIVPKV